MSFFEDLKSRTEAERGVLLSTPQIVDGLNGRITRDTYVAYLTQAYHHVRHTVPLLAAARARLDDSHALFRSALDDYIAEETGHEEWILNDIKACGGDAEAVRLGAPDRATEVMVAYAYDYIARINPMGLFGMVFVLEGTSVALASHGAEAVARSLGLPATAFSYLTSHGALDIDHLRFFERLMDQVTDPADQEAIVHVARRVFHLYADLFAAVPHAREAVHAV